jgi:hypothetical protein
MRDVLIALFLSTVIILVSFVGFSYWSGTAWTRYPSPHPHLIGTNGMLMAARETTEDATITSKIKVKLVLDDHVKARRIGVTTFGTRVTLAGVVDSVEEHDRAVALAHDTEGVSAVVDQLRVRAAS